MARQTNVNAIVFFEAVARHSRVNMAAEELSVSPSAVSQQIKALEEQMGVSLFRRVKGRLVLTEEGERYYFAANTALKVLRDAELQIGRRQEHHSLMIRVSPTFGVRWLGKRVADYIAISPRTDLHVDATSELTDFEKEKVDLEIRYSPKPPLDVHAQVLIIDRVLPLCSPKLARRIECNPFEEVLASTRLLHTVKAFVTWRDWLNRYGLDHLDESRGLRFDRSSMSLQAAADGLGVVLESSSLAIDELRSGALVPLFPRLGVLYFPAYWIVCPQRHLNRRSVRGFVDWAEQQAKAHEQELSHILAMLGVEKEVPLSV